MSKYYEDDLVTLFHGDCLEETAWLDADVLVTDPPYGMKYAPRGTYDPRSGKTATASLDVVRNDETSRQRDDALAAWGDKPAIVFGTWRVARPATVEHRLIWWKRGQAPGPANSPFMSQDEEIYIIGKGFVPSSPPMRSVIASNEVRQGAWGESAKVGHPTPKPIGLMELLIGKTVGTVADPFAGSGSTLVAARNLGRHAIGAEIEERYCELIAKRLSQQAFDFNGGDAA